MLAGIPVAELSASRPWPVRFFFFVSGALTMLSFAPVGWYPLALFLVLQGMRIWIISSLGDRWTTRVITVPGLPLVQSGPYRWLKHPNYIVVAIEVAVLPLAFGAHLIALLATALNATLIAHRIRVENEAIRQAANMPSIDQDSHTRSGRRISPTNG